ncbi:MAG: head decoration protein [Proteobacteria bacterium]|nr:head decoration protein [Pseudomonadota bacterium]
MKAYSFETGLPGLSDFIHSEYDPTYTTDKRLLLAGAGGAVRAIAAFALVASVPTGAATLTPGAVVGTGNGAISALSADAGAQAGVYQVIFIASAANAGTFQVIRPDGTIDGTGNVGVAYNGMINFTQADGGTDFVAGDRREIAVAYPPGTTKDVPWSPTGADGSQIISGANLFAAEAPVGQDVEITVLARGPVVVRREAIAWPAGVTEAQKTAAYARLAELGIQCRVSG